MVFFYQRKRYFKCIAYELPELGSDGIDVITGKWDCKTKICIQQMFSYYGIVA